MLASIEAPTLVTSKCARFPATIHAMTPSKGQIDRAGGQPDGLAGAGHKVPSWNTSYQSELTVAVVNVLNAASRISLPDRRCGDSCEPLSKLLLESLASIPLIHQGPTSSLDRAALDNVQLESC